MKRVFGGLFLVPITVTLAGCAVEKSENPLTPTVAGPLPGVGISAPSTVDPAQGTKIPVTSQPISLTVINATTNGVRPLTYMFEVANDVNFTSLVYQRDNVAPGDGRTTWRLPDPLPTGRTYYWRARAGDGANTGDFSNPTRFDVFTPVVIDRPIPISPVGNQTIDTLQPQFRTTNAPRSGPAGPMSYEVQVSDNAGFVNLFADWAFPETPSTSSLTAPVSLANSKQYYWRIRAYETSVVGPWSDIQGFKTPAPAPVPVPTPTPPPTGGSCGQNTPQAILQCRRNQFPAHMSATNIVSWLKLSAKDINASGTAGGPWGVLVKTSGANCNGYSCDILCLGNGGGQVQRDVLIDAEGAQIPIWGDPMSGSQIAARPCEAQ
jgi:hypothetical protein